MKIQNEAWMEVNAILPRDFSRWHQYKQSVSNVYVLATSIGQRQRVPLTSQGS